MNPQLKFPKPTKAERKRKKLTRRPPARMALPKPYSIRLAEYRAWIRSRPCVVTGAMFVECAHFGPHSYGSKAPDWCVLPLDPAIHEIQGRMTVQEFEDYFHINVWRTAFTLLTTWLEQRFAESGEIE